MLELVLVAILAGIVILIGLTVWASNKITQAQLCRNRLLTMQTMERSYQQTVASGNPDSNLCNQINTLVDQYNSGPCATAYGRLPRLNC